MHTSHGMCMTSYVILCHMENADKFPSVSRSKRKCSKNPRIGRVWEISNHTFPQVWMLLFHQIHILWYYLIIPEIHGICHQFPIGSMGKCMRKCSKNHPIREKQDIDTNTSPTLWVLLFHQISILWYTTLYGSDMGVLTSLPQHG